MVMYVDLFWMSKYSFHWMGICSYVCNSQLLRGMGVVWTLLCAFSDCSSLPNLDSLLYDYTKAKFGRGCLEKRGIWNNLAGIMATENIVKLPWGVDSFCLSLASPLGFELSENSQNCLKAKQIATAVLHCKARSPVLYMLTNEKQVTQVDLCSQQSGNFHARV